MPANENIVELKIFDFDIEHGYITDKLGLKPTRVWVKGEEYFFGDKGEGIKKARENNYWEYRLNNISNDWIGDFIDKFIEDIILPRKDALRRITEQFHTELSIVQYIYDSCNPGLYFGKKAIKVLNDCGLELNIDLYVLSEADKK
ncbi:DUF4279 domain-containing protein [Pontibacter sp. 172403-2]|uniref:DUF4279 domain-containing protein n=1 Tax=Pontibacter rufus TaxID=2791028 RepID=UPI0018B00B92|nr:DUF4279 domain-containing protein [Pontibacter sp. 172403-2]MBF9255815.1 DUF4279 domain-containing protein [Pontibacter sp. 172403-2]